MIATYFSNGIIVYHFDGKNLLIGEEAYLLVDNDITLMSKFLEDCRQYKLGIIDTVKDITL